MDDADSKPTVERARQLRGNLTDAERRLWSRLCYRQFNGLRFRRQAPVGPYIADFVCFSEKLVIEVDGGQHATRKHHDARRAAWLKSQGFRVLRFWNNDVLRNTSGVLETIASALSR
jgi:very-short-patch-repair endonuclease